MSPPTANSGTGVVRAVPDPTGPQTKPVRGVARIPLAGISGRGGGQHIRCEMEADLNPGLQDALGNPRVGVRRISGIEADSSRPMS
jgi:hypothetical protein